MKTEHYLPRALRFSKKEPEMYPAQEQDAVYMARCLELARRALEAGEVPVGALIVQDAEIIAQAYNRREETGNALHHAEVLCIDAACKRNRSWRLDHCTLYVTLEPCPMCAGAIFNARIPRVVYGAADHRAGALGSVLNLNRYPLNHHITLTGNVCGTECLALLREFFAGKRQP